MRVTVLGCGSSTGVPAIGGRWGECDPTEPRNRRRRASIIVETASTRMLVDTSPDLREQLLDAGVDRLDAVLYTHAHADHVHGIDDLRFINRGRQEPLPAYAAPQTLDTIAHRFAYVFRAGAAKGNYQPFLEERVIAGPFEVGDIAVRPFEVEHGAIHTLGFRIGGLAYTPDVGEMGEDAFDAIAGAAVWIVDCFRLEPHWTHAHLDKVIEWAGRLRPGRTLLTHMSYRVDYRTTATACPAVMEPAYDGMVLEIP